MWDHPCDPEKSNSNDFTWHPDEMETKEMLKFLSTKSMECFGVPLVLPSATDELCVTKRGYAKVTSLYKYGCAGCNSKDKNRWFHLCDRCKDALKSDPWVQQSMEAFEQRVFTIREEETPALDATMSSDSDELSCPVCSLELTNAADFNKHIKQKHPDAPKVARDMREKSKYGTPNL